MDERIGFGFYQSCVNMGSVGRMSVFLLRWCGVGGVGWEWVGDWTMVLRGGMVLCLCKL